MQAVILAAGKSTRCYPLTITRPKPLLPIANKPLIFYHLESLTGLVSEVIIIVGYRGEMIREAVGANFKGLKIRYFEQQGLRGTGDALQQVAPLIKGKFILLAGDDLYSYEDVRELAKRENCLLVATSTTPQHFGVVSVKGNFVEGIVEKPEHPKGNLVNVSAYTFEREFLKTLSALEPSPRAELELTDAVNLFARKHRVSFLVAKGAWLPLSHPWKLLEANAAVLGGLPERREGTVEEGAVIKGKLILGRGSVIKSGAYLEGDVMVGENTQIGPNCYIRGPVCVGSGCKIGNAVEVKNSVLMDGAKVGHLSYVGDSVLGYDVNFGAGTITANLRHDNGNVKSMVNGELIDTGLRKLGAIVGDNVHTGIHTSIYPGRKLWPNTATSPGEVVKEDLQG